ncbi:germ cell nuclear acidic protein-like [Ptychodera flava]|uniref:germ cell nuclear acidic protein-like n=1 Tax=Ptychodera flava TaxID=63121 RepID=UPI003969FFEF
MVSAALNGHSPDAAVLSIDSVGFKQGYMERRLTFDLPLRANVIEPPTTTTAQQYKSDSSPEVSPKENQDVKTELANVLSTKHEEQDSKDATPDKSDAVEQKAEQSMPVEKSADQSKPVEQKADQSKPVEQKADQSKPVEQKADQSRPVEQKADQSKPLEQKADQSRPVEQKTDQSRQVEQKTDQSRPVEQKADQSRPVEQKIDSQIAGSPNAPNIEGATALTFEECTKTANELHTAFTKAIQLHTDVIGQSNCEEEKQKMLSVLSSTFKSMQETLTNIEQPTTIITERRKSSLDAFSSADLGQLTTSMAQTTSASNNNPPNAEASSALSLLDHYSDMLVTLVKNKMTQEETNDS